MTSSFQQDNLPWLDEGDKVILQEIINPSAIDYPFEIYYYQPFVGYGQLKFIENGIQLKYPKGHRDSVFGFFSGDLDGDGDIDADDLGCLIAVLVVMGLGYLFKKLRNEERERNQKINWTIEINNRDLQDLSVVGRTLHISRNTRKSPRFEVRFALEDGERFYRELAIHYPNAVNRQSHNNKEANLSIPKMF
jgi:hypothetical protein